MEVEPGGREVVTPASFNAVRTASLSSTTSPKCRALSGPALRPSDSAMNWSPMRRNAKRGTRLGSGNPKIER